MEDAKRTILSSLSRLIQRTKFLHPQAANRTVAVGALVPAARPHISLKARMLGGQAKTISCFRGTWH